MVHGNNLKEIKKNLKYINNFYVGISQLKLTSSVWMKGNMAITLFVMLCVCKNLYNVYLFQS